MPYLYETHMHTCQASKCGRSTGREHVDFYKSMGYTGIMITDHFFGGNTQIDRALPWKDWVDGFWSGYEDALDRGIAVGLDVFFGFEQHFRDDEYLVYGVDKAWMKANPDLPRWNRRQLYDHVHEAGGCLVQAHPFRFRAYNQHIRLGPRFADALETANAANRPEDDARAFRLAKAMNMPMTAGSDNHFSPAAPEKLYGIELKQKLTCIGDYVRLILEKAPIGLHVPEKRFEITPELPSAEGLDPAFFLTEEETLIPSEKNWLYDA